MKLEVLADEFDIADATKAGRNEYGVCRFQLVPTDLACCEHLIEVEGDEHIKFLTPFQMIRPLTKSKKCYGIFSFVLT